MCGRPHFRVGYHNLQNQSHSTTADAIAADTIAGGGLDWSGLVTAGIQSGRARGRLLEFNVRVCSAGRSFLVRWNSLRRVRQTSDFAENKCPTGMDSSRRSGRERFGSGESVLTDC